MNPQVLMQYGGIALVLGLIVAITNMVMFVSKEKADGFGLTAAVHLVSGLTAMGGFWSLAGGFIWFLVDKYAG